jgi:predicted PP-loop superfamily ATPase
VGSSAKHASSVHKMCVRCESCVKIFSHWPTAVLNIVVFGDLLQLGQNQVIYEYLKVDFSLPYSLCVFGDWQEKVTYLHAGYSVDCLVQ